MHRTRGNKSSWHLQRLTLKQENIKFWALDVLVTKPLSFESTLSQDEDGLWQSDPLDSVSRSGKSDYQQYSRLGAQPFVYPEKWRKRDLGRHFFNSAMYCQQDQNQLPSIDGFSFISPSMPYFSTMQDEMTWPSMRMRVQYLLRFS